MVTSVLTALALTAPAALPNLLASAQVRRDEKVIRSSVIRDGQAAGEGEFWDTEATATFGKDGVIEFDLGAVSPIRAIFLQADNNDDYLISGSEDGQTFSLIWKAPPDPVAGMRTRTTRELDAKARYLRLTGEGGDERFSVSELQVFANAADLTPDVVKRRELPPLPPPEARFDFSWLILLGLGVLVVILIRSRGKQKSPPSPEEP